MKALLYEGPQKTAVRDVQVPEIGEDEALVAVHACGLCGSDLIKVFQGKAPPPVALGHEVAGTVAKIGRKVRGFKPGDRVVVAHHVPCFKCHYCSRGSMSMCREFKATNLEPGGFSEFTRVSARHLKYTTLKIAAGMSFEQASQVEPLACCLRNLRRLGLTQGDTAVVIGLGAIGLMTAQALKHFEVSVVGVDLDPARLKLAKALGVDQPLQAKSPDIPETIKKLTQRRGADAVLFTAGTPQLVSQTIPWIRDGGTLNFIASFYPEPEARIDLNELYHREITLLPSYSPAPEDLREAMRFIAQGIVKLDEFVSTTFPLNGFDEAVKKLRAREILKAILLPQQAVGSIPIREPIANRDVGYGGRLPT